jgi:hypothetical protein
MLPPDYQKRRDPTDRALVWDRAALILAARRSSSRRSRAGAGHVAAAGDSAA